MTGTDYSKGINWLRTVVSIPHGKYKELRVTREDGTERIKEFFNGVKEKLDKHIYGLEDVKQEILEFIARKVTNPNGKGEVLALCGTQGVGKTKLIKSLAEALELPFYQINCGGCNDVAVLTGHSETYVGSKAGKIVEALQSSQYMNPIIYLDELDKLSESKSREINGVLTHLLDEEQNNRFQDTYLSNVPLDLSKVFFVLSFNDLSKVDEIVSDRMKILYIDKPTLEEKVLICQEKVIPEIIDSMKFDFVVAMDKEVIEYIVLHKCEAESGIRHLRKCIEKILYKLNYDVLVDNVESLKYEKNENEKICMITKHYVDQALVVKNQEQPFLSMYI
jgi:ATP-dependent Lon protease